MNGWELIVGFLLGTGVTLLSVAVGIIYQAVCKPVRTEDE